MVQDKRGSCSAGRVERLYDLACLYRNGDDFVSLVNPGFTVIDKRLGENGLLSWELPERRAYA